MRSCVVLAFLGLPALLASLAPAGESEKPDRGLVPNQASPHAALRSVNLRDVRWTEGFWADRFDVARRVSLPHLWKLANDPDMGHAIQNLKVAAGRMEGQFQGTNWQDAWAFKWIESASYLYAMTGDAELDRTMDETIELIAAAQEPDGYIASQNTARKRPRWQAPGHHELYTMGHLLTAASAHHRITGKTAFLDVARRCADFLHKTFTPGDPKFADFPYNPSVIMGAVDLYRATGEKRYLELAQFFIDWRGARPGNKKYRNSWGPVTGGSDQTQNWRPLRQENEVVGHAVFFTYLYCGTTDAYMETGESALMTALDRLWSDLTSHKTCVTGGVSPMRKAHPVRSFEPGSLSIIAGDSIHEGVGAPFDLPNDRAYNETCGQIGCVMWNWRMLLATGEARFADRMEHTLYNSVLSGVNLRGDRWSYTNPLRWHGKDHLLYGNDAFERHEPARRMICCPTNLLRTVLSWHNCLYATDETGLWVHHFGASRLDAKLESGRRIRLVQATDYPWDGKITLRVEVIDPGPAFAIHLRIPFWTRQPTLSVNGQRLDKDLRPSSYATIEREWKASDLIELDLPMPVRKLQADPRVAEAYGQVAIQRGPVVYCLESMDLPEGIDFYGVGVPRDASFTSRHKSALLRGVTVLETEATSIPATGPGGPLYREISGGEPRRFTLRLVPYYAWNNRGVGRMTVWLPLR